MSSALFVKKVDLHLHKLLKHNVLIDLSQIMGRQANAGWSKIVPVLMKGWKWIKINWLSLSHAIEREIESELLGESIQWSKRSKETWRRRRFMSEQLLVEQKRRLASSGREEVH
jgi:hypothetical protein